MSTHMSTHDCWLAAAQAHLTGRVPDSLEDVRGEFFERWGRVGSRVWLVCESAAPKDKRWDFFVIPMLPSWFQIEDSYLIDCYGTIDSVKHECREHGWNPVGVSFCKVECL